MQTYWKKDYCTIDYDQSNHLLICRWSTPPTAEEFKENMKAVISAIAHFNTGKVIWDATHLGAVLPEVQEWVATEWISEAVKAGYSYAAFIVPADVFTKMSVEDTVEMGTGNQGKARITSYFDNVEKAFEWIKKL